MPDYMRLSIRILTLLFDTWSYPIKGKPFHRLPLSQRIDQVAAWENSRLEFRHGLIVFYRSFATFGLYSILYGQDYERSEEHTSELLSLMRISSAVFCLTKNTIPQTYSHNRAHLLCIP